MGLKVEHPSYLNECMMKQGPEMRVTHVSYGWLKVQGDPRRPGEINMWAPSSNAKEETSASGSILTIAASVLGCAAIFLKVRKRKMTMKICLRLARPPLLPRVTSMS